MPTRRPLLVPFFELNPRFFLEKAHVLSLLFGRVVKVVLKLPKVQWTSPLLLKISAVVTVAVEGAAYDGAEIA